MKACDFKIDQKSVQGPKAAAMALMSPPFLSRLEVQWLVAGLLTSGSFVMYHCAGAIGDRLQQRHGSHRTNPPPKKKKNTSQAFNSTCIPEGRTEQKEIESQDILTWSGSG